MLWRRQTFDPRIERCAPAVPQHDRVRTSAIPLPAHRPCAAASQQSPAAIVPHGDVGCLVGFRQEGSPPSTPYMRCLIKREDTFASVVRRYMISANLDEAPGDKLKCPISSHRSSFQSASSRMSAGSTSTLPFAAQVRSSLETHLEPFTSCCSFAASLAPPHPCSRRANLTIRTCFLAQGWRSTSTPSILITRSSCLALQVRPRSDLGTCSIFGSGSNWAASCPLGFGCGCKCSICLSSSHGVCARGLRRAVDEMEDCFSKYLRTLWFGSACQGGQASSSGCGQGHLARPRHFFIRDMVEAQEIVVPLVSTEDNDADFFTKPLSPKRFKMLRRKVMNLR